ncbi:MAG: stage II sporulation protein M [Clostridiaceae bacterium]|nr:stage II sporulation protein M [Clostridiaceae bacterium]
MRKRSLKRISVINNIKIHIINNLKLYVIVSIFFLIGILIGSFFIKNIQTDIQAQIDTYIKDFIEILKQNHQIDHTNLLKDTIINHIIFTILIWVMGCSVIGIPIVYGLVIWKGFSLSYTISSIISALGLGKGIIFCFSNLFLQNLIVIPGTLALAVSGVKLYNSIIKDKRKENIKLEIVRHTIFSTFILILLIASSFVETYISTNLTQIYINTI